MSAGQVSLADNSIDSDTPGVLVKGTVDPVFFRTAALPLLFRVLWSLDAFQIRYPSYIVDEVAAYLDWLAFKFKWWDNGLCRLKRENLPLGAAGRFRPSVY